ncbi:ABC transporter ATP-binding protein [Luteimonas aestuarii]|uniref:ABC transporter ATP-binding protein n=1 Tax=Luteimonas aestuarii TaxID=453837 RepID=A0A4R5TRB4_9GAMM|nr:ABC transporter ATP-binding protein [Luteimonas aestuarii]TDK24280.1 ABC transporter ATP-binding protein [Luteimonas aestuarii]
MNGPVIFSAESDPAIRFHEVTKDFSTFDDPKHRLAKALGFATDAGRRFRALDGVSFEVRKGETLGIIGRNGAGKSTLLQILCGTLEPTQGSVYIQGRFAALLELGAGFNPEFTGRENVYLNASLLGLSEDEIDDRFDAIREFADIGDFFDRPVKTYSSGMYVRLAFSVAVHTEPDVLVIDEALSVGDIRFQMKCLARIERLRASGATILFVSHSLEQIKRFCQTAVWLESGRVKLRGDASFVADRFRDSELGAEVPIDNVGNARVPQSLPARIQSVSVSREYMEPFQDLSVEVRYSVLDPAIEGLLVGVAIKTLDDLHIFGPNTYLERIVIPQLQGEHRIEYRIPALPLLSGTYRIDVGLFTDKGLVCLDYISGAGKLIVSAPYFSEGLVYIEHQWRVHEG